MHFPVDRDINYFAQLTAERSIVKVSGGQRFRVWDLPSGRANEALDCRVYAYGALCGLLHLGLKLNKRADEIVLSGDGLIRVVDDVAATPVQEVSLDVMAPAERPKERGPRVIVAESTKKTRVSRLA